MIYSKRQKETLSTGMIHAWTLVSQYIVDTPVPNTPAWKLFISRKAMFKEAIELGRLRGLGEASALIRTELEKME
jgi:hypothetical protein